MLKFDRQKFYNQFREWRGVVTPQQVTGLNFLLDCIEADPFVKRIDWASYMLATTMHETAFTFLPIHEYGSHAYFVRRYGGQTRKGRELGNDTPEEGYDYAGKGDVQLTGESNYEKAEVALRREYPALVANFEKRTGKRFDLTVGDQPNDKDDPKNAQDPEIAYAIMSYGMRNGMFTGHKLSMYLNTSKDYEGARRVINGTDKAKTIAGYAVNFERILRASLISTTTQTENPPQTALPEAEKVLDVSPAPTEEKPSEVAGSANSDVSDTPSNTKISVTGDSIDIEKTEIEKEQQKVAIEKPEPKRFLDRIWKKITGLTGGTVTIDVLTEKAGQVQALGLSADTWKRIFWIVAVAVAAYLIYELVDYIQDGRRDKEITNELIKANTTDSNKVVLVDKDKIEEYRERGYQIVSR